MKSSQFIPVFLMAPAFCLRQVIQKPEAIKDTAAFLEEMGKAMREAMIEECQPSKSKVDDIKVDYPVPAYLSKSQLEEIKYAFTGSWIEMTIPFSSKKTAEKPVVKRKASEVER